MARLNPEFEMNPMNPLGVALGRRLFALVALLAALALHACGGGVEGQGTGTYGYAQGPITGFGSIVVNAVHYDESGASLLSDDGTALTSADLKLGMTVEIDSSVIDRVAGTAVASAVHVRSDLLGRVSASDLTAGTLTVLGQTVKITASTVFDDRLAGGQVAIGVGDIVEVYAIYDPVGNVYAARRIEPEASASLFKLRGQLSALDTTAKTFRVGTAQFVYATAPANLANGNIVKVQVQTTPDGSGRWVVSELAQGTRQPGDGTEVELEGVIATYTSPAALVVAGLPVDASAATVQPANATLAAGVRVELQGTMRSGVLVATKVEVKTAEDGGDGDGGGDGVEYEIESRIVSLDLAAKTFIVKSGAQRVSYASAIFSGGTEANLAVDAKVHVKGMLSADGTEVKASKIEFDN